MQILLTLRQIAYSPLLSLWIKASGRSINANVTKLLQLLPPAEPLPEGHQHQEDSRRGWRVWIHETAAPAPSGMGQTHSWILWALGGWQGRPVPDRVCVIMSCHFLSVAGTECVVLMCSFVQVALLRAHSAEHLILGVARRSLPYNDIILLGEWVAGLGSLQNGPVLLCTTFSWCKHIVCI